MRRMETEVIGYKESDELNGYNHADNHIWSVDA